MGEEHRATIHGFFSLDSFEEGSGMLTQRKAWRPASFGYLGCLVTTPVDEFGPNGYELHAISRSNWERYPEWTHLSFHLRKAAQNKAADFSIRKVRA
jgi:hypothetical protein